MKLENRRPTFHARAKSADAMGSSVLKWFKRRVEIAKRNLTRYEWFLVAVISPFITAIFAMVARSSFEGMRLAVGDQLETLLICGVLFLTPIVLLRAFYLLFLEPDRHQLPDEIGNSTLQFEGAYIYMPDQIRSVNTLVRSVFPDTTVPDRVVTEILEKNRRATLGLYQRDIVGRKVSSERALVGCASCWPVTEEVYHGILSNRMNEDQILSGHVYADFETSLADYFYVPVMLVRDWNNEAGRLQAAALLVAFLDHIQKLFSERQGRPMRVFFVGFTREGINLAKRLGFRKKTDVVQYGVAARQFFELDLTSETVGALRANERRVLLRAIGFRA